MKIVSVSLDLEGNIKVKFDDQWRPLPEVLAEISREEQKDLLNQVRSLLSESAYFARYIPKLE